MGVCLENLVTTHTLVGDFMIGRDWDETESENFVRYSEMRNFELEVFTVSANFIEDMGSRIEVDKHRARRGG